MSNEPINYLSTPPVKGRIDAAGNPDPGGVGTVFGILSDYGHGNRDAHRVFWHQSQRQPSVYAGRVYLDQLATSFPEWGMTLASLLNTREDGVDLTHAIFMHNDVVPEPGFVDTLLDEALRVDADMLSCVIAIKDSNGLTSTAIDARPINVWEVERRLTVAETDRLPETFNAADCGYPERALLANTGLYCLRVDRPWFRETYSDGSLRMLGQHRDRVARCPKTKRWRAYHAPTDWDLSRQLWERGCRVFATRKLIVMHMGECPYVNRGNWGAWQTDQALAGNFGGRPLWERGKVEAGVQPCP